MTTDEAKDILRKSRDWIQFQCATQPGMVSLDGTYTLEEIEAIHVLSKLGIDFAPDLE